MSEFSAFVRINPRSFAHDMDDDELIRFIIALDQSRRIYSFTERLLIGLAEAVREDFDDKEWNEILEKMKGKTNDSAD